MAARGIARAMLNTSTPNEPTGTDASGAWAAAALARAPDDGGPGNVTGTAMRRTVARRTATASRRAR